MGLVLMYCLGDKYDVRSLKKEAVRRFSEDMKTLGNLKSQTRTLLSVVPTVYLTTPDSDRGLRNLLVQHVFERYNTASKHFVEELDTAFEVRQFARDIIVLLKKRPRFNYADVASNVYRTCCRYVPPLPVATTSYFPTAAALRARLLNPSSITVACAALIFLHILDWHMDMIIAHFEQRQRSHRCWVRPPALIGDFIWRVWGLCSRMIGSSEKSG